MIDIQRNKNFSPPFSVMVSLPDSQKGIGKFLVQYYLFSIKFSQNSSLLDIMVMSRERFRLVTVKIRSEWLDVGTIHVPGPLCMSVQLRPFIYKRVRLTLPRINFKETTQTRNSVVVPCYDVHD